MTNLIYSEVEMIKWLWKYEAVIIVSGNQIILRVCTFFLNQTHHCFVDEGWRHIARVLAHLRFKNEVREFGLQNLCNMRSQLLFMNVLQIS